MQLTRHTDYALRLLIDLATVDDDTVQIADVAERQGISRTHLMKITSALAHAGFVETYRGRHGGIKLARAPREINLGDVVRTTEPGCDLVDCTDCVLVPVCTLPGVLNEAMAAFQDVLNQYSLADIVRDRPNTKRALRRALGG